MNKANRIFGLIRRSYQYLDRESMKMLFTALVRPHLEFWKCCLGVTLPKGPTVDRGCPKTCNKISSWSHRT